MPSTLPQRLGLMLLAAVPDIVEGRVIAQDFRAVGTDTIEGVVPGSTVQVRTPFGTINPLIVCDDQGIARPLGGHHRSRQSEVAVWVFYPATVTGVASVLHAREAIDRALDGAIDRLPDDHPYFPGEGTRGVISMLPGIGTVSDGEAVYDRLLFRVSHVRTD